MKPEWWQFVVGAILSWGIYVPVLHEGQRILGGGTPGNGAVRAFLCVGVAYFLTAVVVPLLLMWFDVQGANSGEFNDRGITFATLGGIAGAAGALCIIMSLKYGGSPLFVAPLVFAGAPIVATIVGLAWKTQHLPGWKFMLGIVMAAVGAFLVLYSRAELEAELKKAGQAKAASAQTQLARSPTGAQPTP